VVVRGNEAGGDCCGGMDGSAARGVSAITTDPGAVDPTG
jgi:hypothetical protein